jgi:hypothetical protein
MLVVHMNGYGRDPAIGQRTDKRGSVASALSLIPSSATYPAYQSAAGGRYTPPRRAKSKHRRRAVRPRSAQRLVQLL